MRSILVVLFLVFAFLPGCSVVPAPATPVAPSPKDTRDFAEMRSKAIGLAQLAEKVNTPAQLRTIQIAYIDAMSSINGYLEAVAENEERGTPFEKLNAQDQKTLSDSAAEAKRKAQEFYKTTLSGGGTGVVDYFGDFLKFAKDILDLVSTKRQDAWNLYAKQTRSLQWPQWEDAAKGQTGASDPTPKPAKPVNKDQKSAEKHGG